MGVLAVSFEEDGGWGEGLEEGGVGGVGVPGGDPVGGQGDGDEAGVVAEGGDDFVPGGADEVGFLGVVAFDHGGG